MGTNKIGLLWGSRVHPKHGRLLSTQILGTQEIARTVCSSSRNELPLHGREELRFVVEHWIHEHCYQLLRKRNLVRVSHPQN